MSIMMMNFQIKMMINNLSKSLQRTITFNSLRSINGRTKKLHLVTMSFGDSIATNFLFITMYSLSYSI
jgi:hypothetical protein